MKTMCRKQQIEDRDKQRSERSMEPVAQRPGRLLLLHEHLQRKDLNIFPSALWIDFIRAANCTEVEVPTVCQSLPESQTLVSVRRGGIPAGVELGNILHTTSGDPATSTTCPSHLYRKICIRYEDDIDWMNLFVGIESRIRVCNPAFWTAWHLGFGRESCRWRVSLSLE